MKCLSIKSNSVIFKEILIILAVFFNTLVWYLDVEENISTVFWYIDVSDIVNVSNKMKKAL